MALTEAERKEKQRQYLAKFGIDQDDDTEPEAKETTPEHKEEPGLKDVGEEATAGGVGSEDTRAQSQAQQVSEVTTVVAESMPRASWPGAVYADSSSITYDLQKHKEEAETRYVKVIAQAKVSSTPSEETRRRIASNPELLVYSLKGLIRVIERGSEGRTLLKGHSGNVTDLDFALRREDAQLDHVLGSCAEDGSVILWWLRLADANSADLNDDEPKENILKRQFTWKHPTAGQYYRKIAFGKHESGLSCAFIDRESMFVRVLSTTHFSNPPDSEEAFEEITLVMDENEDSTQDLAWLQRDQLLVSYEKAGFVLWDTKAGAILRNFTSFLNESFSWNLSLLRDEPPLLFASNKCATHLKFGEIRDETFQEIQDIQFTGAERDEVRNIISVDPTREFLVAARYQARAIYIMHYNPESKQVDAITELNVSGNLLSLSVLRNTKKKVGAGKLDMVDDLEIWCVQTDKVQVYIVDARDCIPSIDQLRAQQQETVPTKMAEQTESATASIDDTIDKETDASPEVNVQPSVSSAIETSNADQHDHSGDQTQAESAEMSFTEAATKQQAEEQISTETSDREEKLTAEDEKPKAPAEDDGDSPGAVPSTNQQTESAAVSEEERAGDAQQAGSFVLPDDVKTAVRRIMLAESKDSTKRLRDRFMKEAREKEEVEKERLDRLLNAVSKTIRSKIDEFVGESIHQHLAANMKSNVTEPVCEAVGEILGADTMAEELGGALKENLSQDEKSDVFKIVQEYVAQMPLNRAFVDVLKSSNLAGSFQEACGVMSSQVAEAISNGVSTGISSQLVQALNSMRSSGKEAEQAVAELRAEISKVAAQAKNFNGGLPARNWKQEVDQALGDFKQEAAINIAFESQQIGLLVHVLSQIDDDRGTILGNLSQQVLFKLVDLLCDDFASETELKLAWLSDILLMVEPEDESAQDIAGPVLNKALVSLNSAQKKFSADGETQTAKKLKLLTHVARSLMP